MVLESMNDKVTNKIESDLFEANREDYLVNGNKNWSLLRKHVYLVEQYSKKHFRGKIPAKQDITAVLEKALDSCDELYNHGGMSRAKQKRRENNPAKSTLEKHGITFPQSCSQDYISDVEKISEHSPILYTAPTNQREEAEQLAIVMRESLRQNAEKRSHDVFPSYSVGIPEFPRNQTSTYTSTCTNTNPTSTADCTTSLESQTDLSAANLLLSLSKRK